MYPERKTLDAQVPTCSGAGLAEKSVHFDASIGALVRHGGTNPALEQVTRCFQKVKYRNANSANFYRQSNIAIVV